VEGIETGRKTQRVKRERDTMMKREIRVKFISFFHKKKGKKKEKER